MSNASRTGFISQNAKYPETSRIKILCSFISLSCSPFLSDFYSSNHVQHELRYVFFLMDALFYFSFSQFVFSIHKAWVTESGERSVPQYLVTNVHLLHIFYNKCNGLICIRNLAFMLVERYSHLLVFCMGAHMTTV